MVQGIDPRSFEARVRTRWGLLVPVAIALVFALVMLVVLVFGMVTSRPWDGFLLFVVGTLAVFSWVAIRYIRWQLYGAERVTIDRTHITFSSNGPFRSSTFHVATTDVEGITLKPVDATPWWIQHWGIGGGRVLVHYFGRYRRFGQDLSISEARTRIADMQAALAQVQATGEE